MALLPHKSGVDRSHPNLFSQAINSLVTLQNTSALWAGLFETAQVLESAISISTPDLAQLTASINALNTAQLINGGWSGDPFITALAMRIQSYAINPPLRPDLAAIQGKIIDGQTNMPLYNATITITNYTTVQSTSNFDGTFLWKNLTAGNKQLKISLHGYNSVFICTSLLAGVTRV